MATFGQWTNNRGVYTQTGIPGQPLRPYQFKMGGVRVPNSYTFVDNNYIFGGGYPSNGCCGGSYNPWGGCNSSWNMFGGNMFGGGCCGGGGGWFDNLSKGWQIAFGTAFGLGQVAQGAGALMAAINGPEEQPGGDIAEFADLVTLYGSDKKLSGCAKLDNGQYRCVYNGKVYTASSVDGLSNQIAEDINKGKDSASDDDLQAKLNASDAVLAKGYSVTKNSEGNYEFKAPGTVTTYEYTLGTSPNTSSLKLAVEKTANGTPVLKATGQGEFTKNADNTYTYTVNKNSTPTSYTISINDDGKVIIKDSSSSEIVSTNTQTTSNVSLNCDWQEFATKNPAGYDAISKLSSYNKDTGVYTLVSPTGDKTIWFDSKEGKEIDKQS